MIFRFLAALYVISFWPQLTWRHAVWAVVIAVATFPLKKLWDWWTERFWEAFKLTFMTEFKKSEDGKAFMKAFYESRAKKDAQVIQEHPELKDMLTCKTCGGTGSKGTMHVGFGDMHPGDLICDDCGGTGLV